MIKITKEQEKRRIELLKKGNWILLTIMDMKLGFLLLMDSIYKIGRKNQ